MQAFTSLFLPAEAATEAAGARLASVLSSGGVVFLEGTLGAGKTYITRAIVRACGHVGTVKSPTYTLVEPYELAGLQVYHFDLYRLADAEELEFMGIRDYFAPGNLCLVEWPSRGAGFLPQPDVILKLTPDREGRTLEASAFSILGVAAVEALNPC
ncbi:MAG TPA: tRNA (adenosine(37)-N6)-threonylcarbamoyltransferase complex ATPase subunit type 1 TsaE [Cellvibrionaceae bacterium]